MSEKTSIPEQPQTEARAPQALIENWQGAGTLALQAMQRSCRSWQTGIELLQVMQAQNIALLEKFLRIQAEAMGDQQSLSQHISKQADFVTSVAEMQRSCIAEVTRMTIANAARVDR